MLEVHFETLVLLLTLSLFPQSLDILTGLEILFALNIELKLNIFELFGNGSAISVRRGASQTDDGTMARFGQSMGRVRFEALTTV